MENLFHGSPQYLKEIHDDVDRGVGGDQQVAEVGHDVLLQAGARRQLLVFLIYGVNSNYQIHSWGFTHLVRFVHVEDSLKCNQG